MHRTPEHAECRRAFPPGSTEGEGKILAQTSIAIEDGKLELEIDRQEPTRFTTITQQKPTKTT